MFVATAVVVGVVVDAIIRVCVNWLLLFMFLYIRC